MLQSSVETALTAIRKEVISSKVQGDKQSQIHLLLNNQDYENFDKKLLQELFTKNKQERAKKILQEIKLYEKEVNKAFNELLVKEPFTIKSNNTFINTSINTNLSILNNALFSMQYNKKALDCHRELLCKSLIDYRTISSSHTSKDELGCAIVMLK